ncbi:peptidylprolyl isomerase [Qipengyuania seohaensis]|uniref:peptidylprolyl isomerase n=1 Tax=Qipengyuania seohaensis TaxID=266951 RepID=UPI000C21DB10|nr:peptidylprolyl isomerase [Qipengyuania seohaensis]
MTKPLISLAAALALSAPSSAPLAAQDAPVGAPSPNEIVEGAAAEEWIAIPAEDLLVMTLAPATNGSERKVVIQLMPAPFSQGWVENIRTLARAQWYDDITVNRVQDNYVVQWGDLNYDNPEADGEPKLLPEGVKVMDESDYVQRVPEAEEEQAGRYRLIDSYAEATDVKGGFPVAQVGDFWWPVHCYGMIGVGRNYSPDTGSGAELYTVIGHAPRHLDRNIALVGRIIEGMEHLSSLPRGSGALGFYTDEEADKRTPILTVRVASDLPAAEQPHFEFLSTAGETFPRYADARANRRDPFFIVPAGGADICNIPVPIRRAGE